MASDEEEVGEDCGEDGGWPQHVDTLHSMHQQDIADEDQFSPNKAKKKTSKKPPPVRINLEACKYEVLRIVQRKLGWKEVCEDEEWDVYWTDTSVGIERIMKLAKTQKINHFNGMLEICRKKNMAKNLYKMAKLFPEHYDFFPKTFLLPTDLQELLADVKARGKKQIYIFKPDAGCQGRGIRLLQGGKEEAVMKLLKEMEQQPNLVAQHYLAKPLLVNGFKFDMRIYALVICCDPLRIFIFNEGLARFCTEKYCKPKPENLAVAFMHLTNYAVNKHNANFIANQGEEDAEDASKWTLHQLAEHLTEQGHDWGRAWQRIQQLIVKSLASVQPVLRNNYRSVLPPDNEGFSCFEILGFDIMLDSELQPWLIEVNHSPSFNIDSPLDLAIKEQLITDALHLVRVDSKLIVKAKKADRRAAAGRLLEPLQKRKPAGGALGGSNTTASSIAASGQAVSSAAATAIPTTSSANMSPSSLPASSIATDNKSQTPHMSSSQPSEEQSAASGKAKAWEEYAAIRAAALKQQEKWETKHSGGFTRIYPSDDKTLQGLYEELLRGAAEVYQSTFQAKAKKALDSLSDERRKREEGESEAVKAEKARARAHRDRLAQAAVERRKQRATEAAQLAAEQQAIAMLAAVPHPGVLDGPLCYRGHPVQPGCNELNSTPAGLLQGPVKSSSEMWGDSDAGSVVSSRPPSRPQSARAVETSNTLMQMVVSSATLLNNGGSLTSRQIRSPAATTGIPSMLTSRSSTGSSSNNASIHASSCCTGSSVSSSMSGLQTAACMPISCPHAAMTGFSATARHMQLPGRASWTSSDSVMMPYWASSARPGSTGMRTAGLWQGSGVSCSLATPDAQHNPRNVTPLVASERTQVELKGCHSPAACGVPVAIGANRIHDNLLQGQQLLRANSNSKDSGTCSSNAMMNGVVVRRTTSSNDRTASPLLQRSPSGQEGIRTGATTMQSPTPPKPPPVPKLAILPQQNTGQHPSGMPRSGDETNVHSSKITECCLDIVASLSNPSQSYPTGTPTKMSAGMIPNSHTDNTIGFQDKSNSQELLAFRTANPWSHTTTSSYQSQMKTGPQQQGALSSSSHLYGGTLQLASDAQPGNWPSPSTAGGALTAPGFLVRPARVSSKAIPTKGGSLYTSMRSSPNNSNSSRVQCAAPADGAQQSLCVTGFSQCH